ncbi:hypothetical protein DFH06DRAFT_1121211 [Mycena polygramma]|nr:hypothetical protein DFH06DRAFT_1121211 [Mycena polygramma]
MSAVNNCRDVVLYKPVWIPQPGSKISASANAAENDDVPDLISEEDYIRNPNVYAIHLPMAIDANFRLKRPTAPIATGDLEHREQWVWADLLFSRATDGDVPPLFLDYDVACQEICRCGCHKTVRAKL